MTLPELVLQNAAVRYARAEQGVDVFERAAAFRQLKVAARQWVVHELAMCRATVTANELAAIVDDVLRDGEEE